MEKFFEIVFGKQPGLDLAIAFVTAVVLPLLLESKGSKTAEAGGVALVWLACFLIYRVSGMIDSLFDSLFGPEKSLSSFRNLDQIRLEAASRLLGIPKKDNPRVSGIYKTGVQLFKGREEWEEKVKPYLEYSKAA